MQEYAKKQKIGIMGGTFNPIHNGHLLMAEYAASEYGLSEVVFIPTGIQWMKRNNPDQLPSDIRFEMTKLAIADNPLFSISDIEIKREGNTYTYETLQELTEAREDAQWFYIIGADSLMNMEKWVHPEKIFALAVILCAVRGEQDTKALKEIADGLKERYNADIRLLTMPRIDLSSTDIRKRVAEQKSIRYMVPNEIDEYINHRGLYHVSEK